MSSPRILVVVFSFILSTTSVSAQQRQDRESDWGTVVYQNPEVEGSLFYPLPTPCRLFSLEGTTSGEPMALMARGDDLSDQGGSATGCGIPDDATALMIQVRMEFQANVPIEINLWSTDESEHPAAIIGGFTGQSDSTMVVVRLNQSDSFNPGELKISISTWAVVEGDLVGYFRQSVAGDIPGGEISFYTESTSPSSSTNDFFGYGAGGLATGESNSFFGKHSGYGGTTGIGNSGDKNVFMGHRTGYFNTTGSYNSFFGYQAGYYNEEGNKNAFFGRGAGMGNKTGNDNAFFGNSAGVGSVGSNNVFLGSGSGYFADGDNTVSIGYQAGYWNGGPGNTFIGYKAGYSNQTGDRNVFIGKESGYSNYTGQKNTAVGEDTLKTNEAGSWNTALGMEALSLSTASWNTAVGNAALLNNKSGDKNTSVGQAALFSNQDGDENTAIGQEAGYTVTGTGNTFSGFQAGYGATSGVDNTASGNSFFGNRSGFYNTSGYSNVFVGRESGFSNTTGKKNTAIGEHSFKANQAGSWNTAVGMEALLNSTASWNTAVGNATLLNNTSGEKNTAIGQAALFRNIEGKENVAIGQEAGYNATEDSNTFSGYQAGFGGTSTPGGDCSANPLEECVPNSGYANVFSGVLAGYSNTSGSWNVFSGGAAGKSNTEGYGNVFIGELAGAHNTTGRYNVFSGNYAGDSSTVENNNTLIGFNADLDPGPDPVTSPITNATAIGASALVSQSNSMVLGSIEGVNFGSASVNVGIGTTAPFAPLHVSRSDSTVKIILAESTGPEAVRNMMDLKNNGMAQFRLIDTSPNGDAWQFSNTDNNLNISLQGSGSQEFLIENDGDVWINNGTIMVTSYRASKENFTAVDSQEVLLQLSELPVTTWNYRKESREIRHMGPVSEDFHAAFGLGEDDKHISPNDLAGVNTAAIQGLVQENAELKAELAAMKQELDEIRVLLSRIITDD
jgi:hypothetical protein